MQTIVHTVRSYGGTTRMGTATSNFSDTSSQSVDLITTPSKLIVPFILFFLSAVFLWKNRAGNFPRGPWSYPIVGNVGLFKNRAHINITNLRKTYGSIFSLKIGRHRAVVVCSYESVRQGLVKQSEVFAGRPGVFSTSLLHDGNPEGGVTYSDFTPKYKMKKHFTLCAVDQICAKGYGLETMIISEAENLAYVLSLQRKPCSLSVVFESTILRIMLFLVNGKLYTPADENFLEIWRTYQMRHELALDNWREFVPLLGRWNQHKNTEVLERVKLQYEYQRHITNSHKDRFNPNLASDVIDHMLIMLENNEDSGLLDQDDLDSAFIEVAGSGYKTVAVTLQWIILYLASFPDIQTKVHEELMRVVGKERLPKLSDQPYLPYTCAVILETQRLATVMPFLIPHCVTEETNFMGYTLPVDTIVLFNIWSVHHDPRYWKQPMKFDPQRFLKDGALHIPEHFLPFGDGLRACPGESLVDNMLFLFTSHLLYQLTFDLCDKNDLEGEFKGFILMPKPYKVTTTFIQDVLVDDNSRDEINQQ